MIHCQCVVDLLIEFLEGGMHPDERNRVMRHLQDCPPCLQFVESYKKTTDLCRKTLLRDAPAEFSDRLMSYLREKTGETKGTLR